MRRAILLFLVLGLWASPSCTGDDSSDASVCELNTKQSDESKQDAPLVMELTDEIFDEAIGRNATVLVLFCRPRHERCVSFGKKYEKAAKRLKVMNSTTILAQVDVTEHAALASAASVSEDGAPTLRFFKRGMVYDYTGRMTAMSIVQWVLAREADVVQIISTEEDFTKLTASTDFVLTGFFAVNSSNADALRLYADTLVDNDQFAFGIVSSQELAASLGVDDFPTVQLFRQGNRNLAENEFESVMISTQQSLDTPDTLEEFVDRNRFPLVGEITEKNHEDYARRTAILPEGGLTSLPIVWVFVDYTNEDYMKYVEVLKPTARRYKNKVSVVYLDGTKHREFMESLGIKVTPGMVIVDDRFKDARKYRFKGEIDETNVADFFAKWSEGVLPLYIRTEAAPTGDAMYENDVLVTVGLNFEETVNENKDKFVMMQLYGSERSPGMPEWYFEESALRQKKLDPEYNKMAKNFKGQSDVIIAKCDVTKNEVKSFVAPTGIQVKGLPTMILYPREFSYEAGRGGNSMINIPVEYKGNWTAPALTQWINDKRSSYIQQQTTGPVKSQASQQKIEL